MGASWTTLEHEPYVLDTQLYNFRPLGKMYILVEYTHYFNSTALASMALLHGTPAWHSAWLILWLRLPAFAPCVVPLQVLPTVKFLLKQGAKVRGIELSSRVLEYVTY